MTGQEFLKIQNEKIFRPAVMDAIVNEFEPAKDSFRYTDSFLPMKDVDKDEIVSLTKAGVFGKTNPVALSSDHARIVIPTHFYRDHSAGYWRESIVFDEKTLLRVRKPEKPDELWGEGLVGEAMNVLDLRLNTLIEYLSAQTVLTNGYSVAKNGINYSYNANLAAKYYLKTQATGAAGFIDAPWIATPNDTYRWSATGTAVPLTDIREGVKKMADYGFEVTELWMTRTVGGYIEDNTTANHINSYIQANPALAGQMITAELLVTAVAGLKGLKIVVDDRRYLEETGVLRPITAADTTFYVGDTDGFVSGDVVTLRDPENNYEEEITLNAVSASARTLGTAAGPTNAYQVGSRITVSKKFSLDDRVTFRGRQNARQPYSNWVSTPSLIKGLDWKNPQPGRYTWSTFNDKVPYWIETGAGIHGGPMVYGGGGWMVLKIAA